MSSRYSGFGSKNDDNESNENFVTIGTHFDPAEPTNSTSILATLGRKASKLVDLSASNYGYDGKRFHGAFTGGFNAGFYNTVGSVEGWRPSEFISSRTTRAEKRSYEPEDYMDKGDFSEHGINPKQIKIRSMFDQNEAITRSKTQKQPETSSQRTNDDILRDMIRVKTLSIGKKILMSMGWKPGEGVGVKMSRKHRKKLKSSLTQEIPKDLPPSSPPKTDQQQTPGVKVYGVAMPPPSFQHTLQKTSRLDDDDDDDNDFNEQLYANVSLPPLDYEVHFQLQKREHHGLGYKGLESSNLFGHTNLFVQPSVEKQINNVKIRGQAFGVGIEEDEDDRDLFAEDDLKQYDYELTAVNDNAANIMQQKSQETRFELKFVRYEAMSISMNYPLPVLPNNFRPGHKFPKSAMPTPLPSPQPTSITQSVMSSDETTVKHPSIQHNANTRAILLGDLSFLSRPPPNTSGQVPPPPQPSPEPPVVKSTTIPTPSLEWDVEKERSSQAKTTPTTNARTQFLDAVKNRFTAASDDLRLTERQSLEIALESDLKKAVSMNLYGTLTRTTNDWKPNPLLCKRMNIPNPYPDEAYDDSKESKKSRRQLCSNLFEHLFTQSSTESVSSSDQLPPITIPTTTFNETTKSSEIIPAVVPREQPPAATKLAFANIESFQQEGQERPPLDLFSAIFENQESDEDEVDEKEVEIIKNDDILKSMNPPMKIVSNSSTTTPLASSIKIDSSHNDHSDSSDSSVEEIEVSANSSTTTYGPAIPRNLPPHSKKDHESSIWTKLENMTEDQYEELKIKKKHKKKKKHHKKSKKHHH